MEFRQVLDVCFRSMSRSKTSSIARGAALWGALAAAAVAGTTSTSSANAFEVVPHLAGPAGAEHVEGKKCKCPNGCKMKKWMKTAMTAAVASGDGKKLAKALTYVAERPPKGAGYERWKKIAKDGADAARAGKIDEAKKSCKACHRAFEKKYRKSALRCEDW